MLYELLGKLILEHVSLIEKPVHAVRTFGKIDPGTCFSDREAQVSIFREYISNREDALNRLHKLKSEFPIFQNSKFKIQNSKFNFQKFTFRKSLLDFLWPLRGDFL